MKKLIVLAAFLSVKTVLSAQLTTGNGTIGANATTTNNNVGIGTNAPSSPLSFANSLGSKISLYQTTSSAYYGIGIQNSRLQIHTDYSSADIVFGYGSSSNLTETMRIKGNGNVGIGTNSPNYKLTINGELGFSNVSMNAIKGNTTTGELGIYANNSAANGGFMILKPSASVSTPGAAALFSSGNESTNGSDQGCIFGNYNTATQTWNTKMVITKAGNLALMNRDIHLRTNGDSNHGIGWYGSGKPFGSVDVDGPVLYGFSGGALGTVQGTSKNIALSWATDGKVKIGNVSTPGDYKLYVAQGILTEKVKVALSSSTDWADYVFAPDYKLKPLSEVEAFVKANKHLPNVPSAEQLVKDGGIDVNEMFAKQMEKIEELTLYLIEMKKEIDALKIENSELKNIKMTIQK